MTIGWDWEPAAMRGAPVPDRANLVDKLAYISMRGVYARYQAGQLTAEDAKQKKAEIKQLYQDCMKITELQSAIFQAVSAMLADTAELRQRIRKATSAVGVALLGLDLCAVMDGSATLTGYAAFIKAADLCEVEFSHPRQIDLSCYDENC